MERHWKTRRICEIPKGECKGEDEEKETEKKVGKEKLENCEKERNSRSEKLSSHFHRHDVGRV